MTWLAPKLAAPPVGTELVLPLAVLVAALVLFEEELVEDADVVVVMEPEEDMEFMEEATEFMEEAIEERAET